MADIVILGAGATGLGAGLATGAPVYEAAAEPGGICSSYYVDTEGVRHVSRREDEEDYRFEIGGGHWIFGGNQEVRSRFERFAEFNTYRRRAAVYLPQYDKLVPYPIQEHLDALPEEIASRAREELAHAGNTESVTMDEWMRDAFGDTLYAEFFGPFNGMYTAGLAGKIAPQDAYKTPKTGADTKRKGYNAEFIYPAEGLDALFRGIAGECDVRYGMKAIRIDTGKKIVHFENGNRVSYDVLISTLPLHTMNEMTSLSDVTGPPDPWTSVLVLNAAAVRGPRCPDVHWLYVPESRGGFHRVGFYDNVDAGFLPCSLRREGGYTSMYIEKAYPGGYEPSGEDIQEMINVAGGQLERWGIIGRMLMVDPTFVGTAYTWRRPGSDWQQRSIAALQQHGIIQAGRFARWTFQGIAASFGEGLQTGTAIASGAA